MVLSANDFASAWADVKLARLVARDTASPVRRASAAPPVSRRPIHLFFLLERAFDSAELAPKRPFWSCRIKAAACFTFRSPRAR
jgi:hypothetical protein